MFLQQEQMVAIQSDSWTDISSLKFRQKGVDRLQALSAYKYLQTVFADQSRKKK